MIPDSDSEEVDFQLATGQYLDVYTFDGQAGQNVTLELSSVDF